MFASRSIIKSTTKRFPVSYSNYGVNSIPANTFINLKNNQMIISKPSQPIKHFHTQSILHSQLSLSKLGTFMSSTFKDLSKKRKLTKLDLETAMARVKDTLLRADVAQPVVEQIITQISSQILNTSIPTNKPTLKQSAQSTLNKVKQSFTPKAYQALQKNLQGGSDASQPEELPKAAFVYETVMDRLQDILGQKKSALVFESAQEGSPAHILVTGIQGSGKTTTTAKLAYYLRNEHEKKVLLVSLDIRRPAAQEQLSIMAQKGEVECFAREQEDVLASMSNMDEEKSRELFKEKVLKICKDAMEYGKDNGFDVVVFDSAGRMHVDDQLMDEIQTVSEYLNPVETLLVADSMLGNDAVRISKDFHDKLGVSGICLSRFDADARGGAAISMRAVTGVPIKFVGIGERVQDLDEFDPKGMASRIMGEGDITGLARRARQMKNKMSSEEVVNMTTEIMKGQYNFKTYMKQVSSLMEMGKIKDMVDYLPKDKLNGVSTETLKSRIEKTNPEKEFAVHVKLIDTMTEEEKERPILFTSSSAKKRQLAKRAGVQIGDVNKLIKMYEKMKRSSLDTYQSTPVKAQMEEYNKMKAQGMSEEEIMNEMSAKFKQ